MEISSTMSFRTTVMTIPYSIIVLLLWIHCGVAVKECTSDDDCKRDEGEFCPGAGPYCVPCLQCNQLNREPSLGCARHKFDCGGCLDGFQEGGTDCVPLPKNTVMGPMNPTGPKGKSDQVARAGQSEGISSWLVSLLATIAVAGILSLGTVGYCAYKRRRRLTKGNKDCGPRSLELSCLCATADDPEPTEDNDTEGDPFTSKNENGSYWWVPAVKGYVPENAVEGGRTPYLGSLHDEPLYVARVLLDGNLLPGKLHSSNRCCYVSHCSKEYCYISYDVLVAKPGALEWVASGLGKNEKNAVPGGRSKYGDLYNIGRCQHGRSLVPGKVNGGYCYYSHRGEGFRSPSYDILVEISPEMSS